MNILNQNAAEKMNQAKAIQIRIKEIEEILSCTDESEASECEELCYELEQLHIELEKIPKITVAQPHREETYYESCQCPSCREHFENKLK